MVTGSRIRSPRRFGRQDVERPGDPAGVIAGPGGCRAVAEGVGFEPTNGRPLPVFKTGAFNRSATLPSPPAEHSLSTAGPSEAGPIGSGAGGQPLDSVGDRRNMGAREAGAANAAASELPGFLLVLALSGPESAPKEEVHESEV